VFESGEENIEGISDEERELWKEIAAFPFYDKDESLQKIESPRRKNLKRSNKREKSRPPSITTDGEIDLHGCITEEAAAKLQAEIAIGVKQGWKSLRVIHGGKAGTYGPVQKTVERMVKTLFTKEIAHWEIEECNPGATILYLRKAP